MYQDWAWDAFVAINATTRTGQGFSAISDVNAAKGGSFLNVQESFLFAEVLKYSYLIHVPVSFSARKGTQKARADLIVVGTRIRTASSRSRAKGARTHSSSTRRRIR